MRKAKELMRKLLVVASHIWALISLMDFILDFREENVRLRDWLVNLDIFHIGQLIQIIGVIIITTSFLIFVFIKISNRYKPKRSLVDIVVPLLLSKDDIDDTEAAFDKKLLLFFIIRIGVCFVIIGVITTIVIKLFG